MRKRIIILLVAFILLVFNASAQYKLSGVVRNFKGEPIEGALIEATDLPSNSINIRTLKPFSSVSAKTKNDGSFELMVPFGKHKFSVSSYGYKTAIFDIEGPNGYDVELGSVKGIIILGRDKKNKESSSWSRKVTWNYSFATLSDWSTEPTQNYNLGYNYYYGKNGMEVDYQKAFSFFMKSANKDYMINRKLSYFHLGEMYYYGRGVEKDYKQAFEWYKKSAELGDTVAQNNLGLLFENGQGTKIDLDSAFIWYKIAAGLGSAYAQCNLGRMYFYGYGTGKDYIQAVYWYKKAVEKNNPYAQCYLGYMYENGYGIDKDVIQANYLYKKAAEQGNAQAQFNIGYNFENGEGVEKNINEAIYWYQKAADNNHERAKDAIARLQNNETSKNKRTVVSSNSSNNRASSKPKNTTPRKVTQNQETNTTNNSSKSIETKTTAITNQKRIALVLGNGDYKLGRLPNPINDVKDISKKLVSLGFKTIVRTNEQKGKTREIISQFAEEAKQYDAILFYYAGHAIQDQGVNFLIPINAIIESPGDVEDQCISLNWVLRKMNDSGANTKIIILDACRDNPVANSWERGIATEGLSSIGNVPEGTFLVYSAQAGKKAKDGVGKRNSPFAEALLKALDIPMLPVHDMFHRVKNMVAEKTNNTQVPSQVNNLVGDFYFNTRQTNE